MSKSWKNEIEIKCPVCDTIMETAYIYPDKARMLKCDHIVIKEGEKWVLILEKEEVTKKQLPKVF